MILVDTDVLVDLARSYSPAVKWLKAIDSNSIVISGFSYMELIQGCKDIKELHHFASLYKREMLVWPSKINLDLGLDYFEGTFLRNRIGILDTLIAATAIELDCEFASYNLKHYNNFPKLKLIQPYERTPQGE